MIYLAIAGIFVAGFLVGAGVIALIADSHELAEKKHAFEFGEEVAERRLRREIPFASRKVA